MLTTAKSRLTRSYATDERLTPSITLRPEWADSPADRTESLKPRLIQELWSRLVFSRFAEETGHRCIEQIIQVASSSCIQLQTWHGDLRSMAAAVCDAAIELRSAEGVTAAEQQQAVEMKRDEQLEELGPWPLPPRSFVDYQFADLPPELAMSQARDELWQDCVQLVNDLWTMLETLRTHQLAGNVDWTATTCRVRYYRRVLLQDKVRTGQIEDRIVSVPHVVLGEPYALRHRQKIERRMLTTEHRTGVYDHHVLAPQLRTVETAVNLIPLKYQQLLQAIPEWVSPFVRVLEGEMIREDQIERQTRTESLESDLIVIRSDPIYPPTPSADPAILIGDFVLAGWNEQAINDESHRRDLVNQERIQHQARGEAKLWLAGTTVLLILAVGLMLVSRLAPTWLVPSAVLMGVVAIGAAAGSVQRWLFGRGQWNMVSLLLGTTAGGFTVFAPLLGIYGLLYWAWPAVLLSLLFGFTAYGLLVIQAHRFWD